MVGFLTGNGTFFERNGWSEDLDESFLCELAYAATRVGRSLSFGDNEIFAKVLENMQIYTNLQFNITDIHHRFKLAHLRYNTWKSIIEHEAIVYNPATYSVTASIWTWIEICESFEIASAYHKVSMERMWPELNAIFGPAEARSPTTQSLLPKKPPRAFENIDIDGNRIPTIDEIIADVVEEEKRVWELDQKRKQKKAKVVTEFVPADMMSTTKGSGQVVAPAREVLVISPELNRPSSSANGSRDNVRAKRHLSFEFP